MCPSISQNFIWQIIVSRRQPYRDKELNTDCALRHSVFFAVHIPTLEGTFRRKPCSVFGGRPTEEEAYVPTLSFRREGT